MISLLFGIKKKYEITPTVSWQPTPVFPPGESQGWGSLVAAIGGVAQSRTRLKRLSSSSRLLWNEDSIGQTIW